LLDSRAGVGGGVAQHRIERGVARDVRFVLHTQRAHALQ
jgi:hypothetical protein